MLRPLPTHLQAAGATRMDPFALRHDWFDLTEAADITKTSSSGHLPTPASAVWHSRVMIALKALFVLHRLHVADPGSKALLAAEGEAESHVQLSNSLLQIVYHCIAGPQLHHLLPVPYISLIIKLGKWPCLL